MTKSRRTAQLGMLLALACVLSFAEGLVPTTGLLPPGVKLGLSNLVTMYTMLFLGLPSALTVGVLKAAFVLLTRGAVAGLMSLCGGVLSILVMFALVHTKKLVVSCQFVGICGAVGHNLGQLTASCLLLGSLTTLAYAPVLILSGIIMGTITSLVFFAVAPAFHRIA